VTLRNIERGQVISTDQSLQFWREHNACDPSPTSSTLPDHPDDEGRTQTIRHDYTHCQAPVTLLEVVGGGHTWPGTTQYLPNFVIGHTARDYHANDVIWAFFQSLAATP
jgi:polyhydroxybutyrate depolymerase